MLQNKLNDNENLLNVAFKMEDTDGEPSFVLIENKEYARVCLAKESPKPRRSFCYDDDALNKRNDFKPSDSAAHLAATIRGRLLSEEEYIYLQNIIVIVEKSSTWLLTPYLNRELGGPFTGSGSLEKSSSVQTGLILTLVAAAYDLLSL